MFKLEQNDISDILFDILQDLLHNLKQKVVLSRQVSSCANVTAGQVPRFQVLCPFSLILIIYQKDSPQRLNCFLMIHPFFLEFMRVDSLKGQIK